MNQEIDIQGFSLRLNYESALQIFLNSDLIIDGSDNYTTRYMVNDVCCQLRKPLISASVLRHYAQVAFFDCQSYCYRCLYPEFPPAGVSPSCAEAGVIGAVAGVIGTVAANFAINYFLGKLIKQKLMVYDADEISWESFNIIGQQGCLACQQQHYKEEAIHKQSPNILEVDDFQADDYIIDVREPWELDINSIEMSYLALRLNSLLTGQVNLNELPQNRRIVCLCKTGVRSKQAVTYLLSKGFVNVVSFRGGVKQYLHHRSLEINY